MGMHVMAPNAWEHLLQDLQEDTAQLKKKILNEAHTAVRKFHNCPEGTLDVTASTDGSWHKPGHISLHGVGFVIEYETGLIVDWEVLSKYCHLCSVNAALLGSDKEEYNEWLAEHKFLKECQINHEGSSGAMESAAAVAMWTRSEEKFQLRYTTMVADGDTSSLANINEAKPYGPDVEINKEECINHIAKRMTKGLKEVVENCKVLKTPIGGRGQGTLTENAITTLTSYYRNAIIDKMPNTSAMQQAIMASLYHCASTDKKPNHRLCPKGEWITPEKRNWCFYNRAKALRTKPESHDKMSLKLNSDVVKHIKPVYERLSDEKIMKRCTLGATQNANESLHSVVWKYCPKKVFVGRQKLEMAVAKAVAEFNMGASNALSVRKEVA